MQEKVLMKGNEAIAEAAIRAGCRHYFGYPITPQTEISVYMAKRMPKVGGCFVQSESELAAINMVYGAASTGKRAMTSSSSPGVSLKTEGISYIAGSDLPALIVNVERGGPGLGGIQPSQSDYFMATRPGHGDFHLLVFAPSTVQEMMDYTRTAFELAEKYRVPAMLIADGSMGQMMEPVTLPEPIEPSTEEKDWATTGTKCKRKHRIVNSLELSPLVLEEKNIDRFRRYEIIEREEPRWESFEMDDAEICIVSCGITARVAKNAILKARANGIKVGMIRPITLWPFPKKPIFEAAQKIKCFITVELNMGQMKEDVDLAARCTKPIMTCNRVGGMIPTPDEVYDVICKADSERG